MVTPISKPITIVEPFANNGPKNTIPVTSNATPGSASLDQGFPSLTMVPVYQGGVPPSGLDFNGILNWITQHTVWVNAGGMYTFDATLSAAAGGYKKGAVLMSDDLASTYVSLVDNNTANFNTNPSSIGAQWVAIGGAALIKRAARQFSDYYSDAGTVGNAYVVPGLNPNSELVTNGDFNNGTSGWAPNPLHTSTSAAIGGEMQVTATGPYGGQSQTIQTVQGKQYILSLNMRKVAGIYGVYVATTDPVSGADIQTLISQASIGATATPFTAAFVATGSQTTITLRATSSSTYSGEVAAFGKVSVKDAGELVTNGQFTADTSGWASGSSFPSTAAAVGGEMRVTPTVVFGRQIYAVPTVPGVRYSISAMVRRVSGVAGKSSFGVCASDGGDISVFGFIVGSTATLVQGQYTAISTTTYIQCGTSDSTDVVAGFSSVTVKATPTNPVQFRFRTTRANTGPATVDFSQGIYPLRTEQGNELAAGDIAANSITSCVFDPALGYAIVTETVLSQLIGDGLENNGAGGLRVKLADGSLRRTAGGVSAVRPVGGFGAGTNLTASLNGYDLVATSANSSILAPAASFLGNGFHFSILAQAGPVTFTPNATDSVNGAPAGTPYTVLQGQSVTLVSDGGTWYPMFQTTVQGAFSPRYVTTSQTLGAGTYWVDTTAGPITVTLPTGVAAGTVLEFSDAAGTWGVNPMTLARNGNTILGTADNLVCDVNGETFKIWFNGSDWRLF